MEIQLTKCKLRFFVPDDAKSIAHHANNMKIAGNLRNIFPFPYSLKDAEFFINQITNSDSSQVNFAIDVDGKAVGSIGFHLMSDVYQRNVEVGYWLGEKYWGQGIASEALNALVKYIFRNYSVNRIFANVFETNIASMKVLEKCGFAKEAIHRNAIIKNGKVMDEHVFVKLFPLI
jgi:[ribosomal protein S5]-alanine N-acetyltransferase